jgi:hypothetical protein
MNAEAKAVGSFSKVLAIGFLAAATAAGLTTGAVAQAAAPLPPVIINSDSAATATVDVPNPSGPPIPKAGTETARPLQSVPPRIQTPFAQVQAATPQALTIGEIVAANVETPDKICAAVTPIIMAEPGEAYDLIETAKQRPKQMEALAQCLSQIQTMIKKTNPDGAKSIDALVAAAPAGFQAAYAVALANADSGDAGSVAGDADGGGGTSGGGDGGSSSGGGTASSGGGGEGGGGGGGTGFSGFAGGGAIGGSGGGNFGIPVSRNTP